MSDSQSRARLALYERNADTARREGRYLDAERWDVLAHWQRERNQRTR